MTDDEETQVVELLLTPRETKALRELAQHYLGDGDPAFVCMQEWDDPHTAETLRSLRATLLSI